MLNQNIIQLLSHHRSTVKPYLPQALTRFQLLGLLRSVESPGSNESDRSLTDLNAELQNLEAQGEILLGIGKRVCMAPPVVITDSQENSRDKLQFLGDRAYLKLAHQVLATKQPIARTLLKPQKPDLNWIQKQLRSVGIQCLTTEESINQLPSPELPAIWSLTGQELEENPFFTYQGLDAILGYQPCYGTQRDRWQQIVGLEHLMRRSPLRLLRTPENEFLWLQDGQFFAVTPDTAYLAMFRLDQQSNQPLQIALDEESGRLDLRGTYLPKAYAQLIWRLSTADSNHNRIRYVDAQQQPRVKAALKRLGCVLV
jgi:hypothetical protein